MFKRSAASFAGRDSIYPFWFFGQEGFSSGAGEGKKNDSSRPLKDNLGH